MAIKWTEKDFLEHLEQLKNPFEQAGMQSANLKPKLSDILNTMGNVEETETPEIPKQVVVAE